MTIDTQFDTDRAECIETLSTKREMSARSNHCLSTAQELRYSYNFDLAGLPITQHPQEIVAFDTLVEDISGEAIGDRSWSKESNPKMAVWEFLKEDDRFVIDASIHQKLRVTVAPDGFLKRVE